VAGATAFGAKEFKGQGEYFKLSNYFPLSKLQNYCSKQQDIQPVNSVCQQLTISVRQYNCRYQLQTPNSLTTT